MVGNCETRVLVIESNSHIRRLIATLLRSLGITAVMEARSPAAALPQMAAQPADFIIVDWTADATAVLLFVHRVRQGEFGDSTVPVLALTHSTDHAIRERAWLAGIDDVLPMPLSATDLLQRATNLLGRGFEGFSQPAAAAE